MNAEPEEKLMRKIAALSCKYSLTTLMCLVSLIAVSMNSYGQGGSNKKPSSTPTTTRRGSKPAKKSRASQAAQAKLLTDQALNEAMRSNYREAQRLADNALQLQSDLATAVFIRGWMKIYLNDHQGARADLERAVQMEPTNGVFRAALASEYSPTTEAELRKQTAEAALQLLAAPKTALDYYAKALSYRAVDNGGEALSSVSKAIEINPQFAIAYRWRGYQYQFGEKSDLNAALRDFTKVIEINGQGAGGYGDRGSINYSLKNYDDAIRDCTKAMELNPDDTLSLFVRAFAYLDKGDYEPAIRDATKYIDVYPQRPFGYRIRGLAYEKTGRKDLAAADLKKYDELYK
jgi:tetratricopeptide (TPR) repeat protein